jgi:hypothetical protein
MTSKQFWTSVIPILGGGSSNAAIFYAKGLCIEILDDPQNRGSKKLCGKTCITNSAYCQKCSQRYGES